MIQPYSNSPESKKGQIELMFNNIARNYDQLNHLLSFNIDKLWRKKAVRMLGSASPRHILDLATGTGDFAIAAAKLKPLTITGIDISPGMLEIARKKIRKFRLNDRIDLLQADSENLPFQNNSFDAAMVAFGVRNFEDLNKGLAEVLRVLVNGGTFLILEFSKPGNMVFRLIYNFYFKQILPLIGRVISKDSSAYKYLPASVDVFPDGIAFLEIMKNCGFVNCRIKKLTFGIASIYIGEKDGFANKNSDRQAIF